jgi:hypothetical protein
VVFMDGALRRTQRCVTETGEVRPPWPVQPDPPVRRWCAGALEDGQPQHAGPLYFWPVLLDRESGRSYVYARGRELAHPEPAYYASHRGPSKEPKKGRGLPGAGRERLPAVRQPGPTAGRQELWEGVEGLGGGGVGNRNGVKARPRLRPRTAQLPADGTRRSLCRSLSE